MQRARPESGREKHRACRLTALLTAALAAGACVDEPSTGIDSTPAAKGFLPDNSPAAVGCGPSGRMRGSLYGALNLNLDWNAESLNCEGMPRPDARGARLRFAGKAGEVPIAIIIAIPALERAKTATELPSKVTIIEEGNGRFFSTVDADNCWTDITGQVVSDDGSEQFVVDGRLYCISPLVEVNGSAGVSITDLSFRGLLDWSAG